MIKAAKWARERKTPYLGICLGMQVAVIEGSYIFGAISPVRAVSRVVRHDFTLRTCLIAPQS
jgi:CTP synthase (UTP-ammonia lyase)